MGEHQKLAEHGFVQTVAKGDAVADGDDGADVVGLQFLVVVFDLLFDE